MGPTLEEKKILIGLNITYYRKARRLTQIELADQLEVSSNYLSQIERGSKFISLTKLIKVAELLDIDAKALLDFSRFSKDSE